MTFHMDYMTQVLLAYEKKRDAGMCSTNLSKPTPARLRKECLIVYRNRYHRRDEALLREFFAMTGDQIDMAKAIRSFDIDRFKPLQNFLNRKTSSTDHINVELIAWLLDFSDRPYYKFKERDVNDLTESAPLKSGKGEEEEPGQRSAGSLNDIPAAISTAPNGLFDRFSGGGLSVPPKKKKPLLLATVILAVAGMGAYLFWPDPPVQAQRLLGPEQCMYWTGDHYEQISCNQSVGESVMVIAFDSTRFHHLKMITQPDTITHRSVGSLWYIKSRNQVEFYTAGGTHPVNPQLRLKPATVYIIDKYVLAKQQAN